MDRIYQAMPVDPIRAKLEAMAKDDPIIYRALAIQGQSGISDLELYKHLCVALAEAVATYRKLAEDALRNAPVPPVIFNN